MARKNEKKPANELVQMVLKMWRGMSDDERDGLIKGAKEIMASSEHIDAQEWQWLHPTGMIRCGSDSYYVKLVNRLINKLGTLIVPGLPAGLIRQTAVSIAIYLEDIVNDFGVWHSLRVMHRETYGTWLPFYDCGHEEYLTDNVNIEDLKFIIWQAFCRCGQLEERIFSPYSNGIETMAQIAFDEIVDEFEKAPESGRISAFITQALQSDNYFKVREAALWLTVRNPLVAVPFMNERIEEDAMIMTDRIECLDSHQATYLSAVSHAWKRNVGAEGVPVQKWLATICRHHGLEDEARIMEQIEPKAAEIYEIAGCNDKTMILKDRLGSEYEVEQTPSLLPASMSEYKGYNTCLVRFNGKWEQNGMGIPVNSDLFTSEWKKPVMSDSPHPAMLKTINEVIDSHSGQQIFICKGVKELKTLLKISSGSDITIADRPDSTFVVLLSRTDAPTILNDDYVPYFKLKGNRRYSKVKSADGGLSLLLQHLPDDVAKYIQDNQLTPDLMMAASQGPELGRAIVQDNFRFLAGFARTAPAFTAEELDEEY